MSGLALSAKFDSYPGSFSGPNASNPIGKRLRELEAAEKRAGLEAAKVATEASRNAFRYLRPPDGTQRNKRSSTGGRFGTFLEWDVEPSTGQVAFDVPEAESRAPHWIILELGTGEKARMREGGDEGDREGYSPNGVASKSGRVRTVRSQKGRRIHPAFVFASGGAYSPTGSSRTDQLQVRSRVTGAPRLRRGIVIKKEIKGQHFIQKGAQAGFRQYRESVLAAARKNLSKGRSS